MEPTGPGPASARSRGARRIAATVVGLLALLYVANVPFYAGSTLPADLAWRMEHGRITVSRSPGRNPQSFWVAPNAEGLRFGWHGRRYGPADWTYTVPLWAPLGLAVFWCVRVWRRSSELPQVRQNDLPAG